MGGVLAKAITSLEKEAFFLFVLTNRLPRRNAARISVYQTIAVF
ncbi:MAG TPA: hypothetical protein VE641_00145 [Chthoniobacterales bacterium]|jgi:hypothetical protein|nr:hypothetical protein [Chthoniobacterales bacterium]